mmetsp:Transcript_2381/g.5652  ORF Transcript_2381/g.5652 Transcript_2381/m.5652 type:complete len:338 (-) Transcript_2381:36-1049(-)
MALACTVSARGRAGQINIVDVVIRGESASVMVFFPGDISAARNDMIADPDVAMWQEWSTESIAELLASRFPSLHIIVVRPSRQEEGYSSFDHFLATDETGDPLDGSYTSRTCAATEHLMLLLKDLSATFNLNSVSLCESLYVVGFSKGGTVVNQLFTEIGAVADRASLVPAFVSGLRALVWLDPGVNNGCRVFVSDEDVMRSAAGTLRLTCPLTRLVVVFSPFQLYSDDYMYDYDDDDDEIPATSVELGLDRLQSVMTQESIPFEVELCCFDRQASLLTHFQVIQEFNALGDLCAKPKRSQSTERAAKRSRTFAMALQAARNGVQRAKTLSLTCSCM